MLGQEVAHISSSTFHWREFSPVATPQGRGGCAAKYLVILLTRREKGTMDLHRQPTALPRSVPLVARYHERLISNTENPLTSSQGRPTRTLLVNTPPESPWSLGHAQSFPSGLSIVPNGLTACELKGRLSPLVTLRPILSMQ